MDTLECIEKRRSIRVFNDIPVEWEKVGNILRAGQLAPSSGNIQDWKFVVVTDKTKRAAIANAALKQHWIATAPVIIIIYSDPKPTQRFYGLRGEKLYTIQNCAAAAANMLLAATEQGLASCWVGAFDEVMINQTLGAPSNVRPQVIIPVGYSDKHNEIPQRYKLVDLTYINNWKGKVVNVDLLFDEFSGVMKKKATEAKEALAETGTSLGKELAEKGKSHVRRIHEKIKAHLEKRKQKKKEDKQAEEDIENPTLKNSQELY